MSTRRALLATVLVAAVLALPARASTSAVGDVNGDGVIDGRDVFYLINYLHASGVALDACRADANGDGPVNNADVAFLIAALYGDGPQPSGVCPFPVDIDAVYVSGDDVAAVDNASCGLGPAGSGGGRFPCKTIGQGIIRALALPRSKVLVADATYNEAVTLVSGRSVLGGYHPDTWERHLATTTTIVQGVSSTGNHDRTIIAIGISSATVFEGFVVRGALNSKASGNSYAIYVANSSANLAIRNNVIQAGRGGPGAGVSASANGAPGANGGGRDDDPTGYDAKIATGTGACNASNNRQKVNGGITSCGGGANVVNGGDGGGNKCPTSSNLLELSAIDGANGQPGAGAGGGPLGTGGDAGDDGRLQTSNGSDLCFVPAASMTGADGISGGLGADAAAVAGCTIAAGSVVGGHWIGGSAQAGLSGSNGGGAGGGGAGGGAFCFQCTGGKDRFGGQGGGGGAGGCGGGGGGAGSTGGGVFGIFIAGGTAPAVTGNVITRGDGGSGTNGGNAGNGGPGGTGGLGGSSGAIFCVAAGGRGGNGGTGGHGSGGGGGCGGSSYGIYTSGIGTPSYCTTNTINGGSGGQAGSGGLSLGNGGGAGQPGILAACSFN